MKIAILTGASLSWNPRAFKEAGALAHAGNEVVVIGSSWDAARFETDRRLARSHGFEFQSAMPVSAAGDVAYPRLLSARARGRLGRMLFKAFGIETPWQIGPIVSDLMNAAIRARADYYIAHMEHGAWVGCKLLEMGRRVGIDMEDWYSEDLLPEARKMRPIRLLRDLEKTLLLHGGHATCPSHAMSAALAGQYGCTPPVVIYNAFPWSDRNKLDGARKDRRDSAAISIHWVSQMLGPGRGLEDLFAALPMIRNPIEVHLRGHRGAGLEDWLDAQVPESHRARVFVHEPVDNEELLSRISEHDIGFAGEMKYCANKDLTISNKLLHYLLGGCAVVASNTAGQREAAAMAPGAIQVYSSGDPAGLAGALNELTETPGKLDAAKAAAVAAARETFCWERQESILLDSVARAAFGRADGRE